MTTHPAFIPTAQYARLQAEVAKRTKPPAPTTFQVADVMPQAAEIFRRLQTKKP